ncbi:MAG TPA: hypothetical protein VND66_11195 [Acidobacteriaceae bacterium]|nr:hypothetical protein [Acidobacteriaceae bacterium]
MKHDKSSSDCRLAQSRARSAWLPAVRRGVALFCLLLPFLAQGIQLPSPTTTPSASTDQPPSESSRSAASNPAKPTQPTHITPEQAQQLFNSVDAILQFDGKETGLPVLHPVKRRLVTRDEVEHYLTQQLHDDRDAKRLQRSELVLKKFGLLDRDFQLQPFLVRLLREQIAGYYNDKTKTVNLLDWIPPEEQKPVLAHELTHALQDQYIHLEKWDRSDDRAIAKNAQQDNEHIATDEEDTVRDAVIEGQAMAVFIDYILAPSGKTLLNAPQLADKMNDAMSDNTDSPTLANAPLVLQRSLIFPYVDGLDFVRAVLAAKGEQAAFAGMLHHPPTSTYEIMTPKIYLDHQAVPLLHMPDIHALIDPLYRPYDVGVMGEFDVQVMAELFGGPAMAAALAPAWRGGIYYAAQSKAARTEDAQDSTASLALLYLSRWATPQAAQAFATIYAREIPRKYDHVTSVPDANSDSGDTAVTHQIWDTSEGPVLIAVSGKTVFISESFPLDLARKLEFVMMGSIAESSTSVVAQSEIPRRDLTSDLRHSLFATLAPERFNDCTVY